MEYASFYGGRPGQSIVIAKSFDGDIHVDNGIIKQGESQINTNDLNYGDYFILNPDNRSKTYYGDIYQLGINNTYKRIGNFGGKPGPAPTVEIDDTLTMPPQGESSDPPIYSTRLYAKNSSHSSSEDSKNDKPIIFIWQNNIEEDYSANNLKMNFEIPLTQINFDVQELYPQKSIGIDADSDNTTHAFKKHYTLKIPKPWPGDQLANFSLEDEGLLTFDIKRYVNTTDTTQNPVENWKSTPQSVQIIYPKNIKLGTYNNEDIPGYYIIEYTGDKTDDILFTPVAYDFIYDSTQGILNKKVSYQDKNDNNTIKTKEEAIINNFKWIENIGLTPHGSVVDEEQQIIYYKYNFNKKYNIDQNPTILDNEDFILIKSINMSDDGTITVEHVSPDENNTYTQTLGSARSWNGILVGPNLSNEYNGSNKITDPETEAITKINPLSWLYQNYREGITDPKHTGKMVIITDNDDSQRIQKYYAYDPLKDSSEENPWFELNFASANNQTYISEYDQNLNVSTNRYAPSFLIDTFYDIYLNIVTDSDQSTIDIVNNLDKVQLKINRGVKENIMIPFTNIYNQKVTLLQKGDIINTQIDETLDIPLDIKIEQGVVSSSSGDYIVVNDVQFTLSLTTQQPVDDLNTDTGADTNNDNNSQNQDSGE